MLSDVPADFALCREILLRRLRLPVLCDGAVGVRMMPWVTTSPGHAVDRSNVQLLGSAVMLVLQSPHASWCKTCNSRHPVSRHDERRIEVVANGMCREARNLVLALYACLAT